MFRIAYVCVINTLFNVDVFVTSFSTPSSCSSPSFPHYNFLFTFLCPSFPPRICFSPYHLIPSPLFSYLFLLLPVLLLPFYIVIPFLLLPRVWIFAFFFSSTCCHPSICLPHPPHRTGLMTQVCSPIREASQSGLWCWGTSSGKGLRLPTGWDPCVVMETVSNISLAGYCFTGRRCQS